MRLLLDTRVMLRALTGSSRLRAVAREQIADPFDRVLVAQAMAEPMRLLSRDATLAGYGAMVMAV